MYKMTEEILQINENITLDKSIEEYEVTEYTPVSGTTDLNKAGEIRIIIQHQDEWVHPSESYLLIEGQVTKKDGTAFADDEKIAFCNNGLMHMFEYITYRLSGQEIENINYLGQATTMLGMLLYSEEFQKSEGLNMMFYRDTNNGLADGDKNQGFAFRHNLMKYSNPNGFFSFSVPLKHIFGFADDYNKIIWGMTHQLTLKRKSEDNDSLFKNATAVEGKITLHKLSWYVPHIRANDEEKFKLNKIIENKSSLNVGFRVRECDSKAVEQTKHFQWRLSTKASAEKPRWIIVGFQTDKDSDQTKNTSIFDHLDLKNIYVTLNSRRYPKVDYDLSFKQNQFSRVYRDAANFKSKFYNIDGCLSGLYHYNYRDLYPLFVFDVSKQSERLKYSITDITVNAFFNTNVPAGTHAYALVISDKILTFKSDGNQLTVVIG
jgi:hypothetical protein